VGRKEVDKELFKTPGRVGVNRILCTEFGPVEETGHCISPLFIAIMKYQRQPSLIKKRGLFSSQLKVQSQALGRSRVRWGGGPNFPSSRRASLWKQEHLVRGRVCIWKQEAGVRIQGLPYSYNNSLKSSGILQEPL
jgi:hypothetical protein